MRKGSVAVIKVFTANTPILCPLHKINTEAWQKLQRNLQRVPQQSHKIFGVCELRTGTKQGTVIRLCLRPLRSYDAGSKSQTLNTSIPFLKSQTYSYELNSWTRRPTDTLGFKHKWALVSMIACYSVANQAQWDLRAPFNGSRVQQCWRHFLGIVAHRHERGDRKCLLLIWLFWTGESAGGLHS
jgi:hypothetical protein